MFSEELNVISLEHEGEIYNYSVTEEEYTKILVGDQDLANSILQRELERRDRLLAFKIWKEQAKKRPTCTINIHNTQQQPSCSKQQPSCSKDSTSENYENQFAENVMETSETCLESGDLDSALCNRWTDAETKLLLELYRANSDKLKDKKFRPKAIFADIAKNFDRFTEGQIETKIKNLKKTYKTIVDNNKTTGRGRVAWPYFNKMHEIFGADPENEPVSIASNVLGVIHSNTENNNDHAQGEQPKKKKARIEPAEPVWFRSFREEAAQRHRERMESQNRFLDLFQQWINKDKE